MSLPFLNVQRCALNVGKKGGSVKRVTVLSPVNAVSSHLKDQLNEKTYEKTAAHSSPQSS
jgi:hypothetical protein